MSVATVLPLSTTPDGMSLRDLESELLGLAGHIAAAECRFLQLLAEFDDRDGWAGDGIRSCAHWLSWRAGMSLRTAVEHLCVARALQNLPRIREAFAAGRISYSKVRAITRITGSDTATLTRIAAAIAAGESGWRHTTVADPPCCPAGSEPQPESPRGRVPRNAPNFHPPRGGERHHRSAGTRQRRSRRQRAGPRVGDGRPTDHGIR